jgi:hypothetical protein
MHTFHHYSRSVGPLEAALKHRGVPVQSLLAKEQNTASLRKLFRDIDVSYGLAPE